MGLNENILLSSALGASNLCKNFILLLQLQSFFFDFWLPMVRWRQASIAGSISLPMYLTLLAFDTSDALHLNCIRFVIFYMAIVSICLWVCIFWLSRGFCLAFVEIVINHWFFCFNKLKNIGILFL